MELDIYDCPYMHRVQRHYCNLFKGYQNCEHKECEVLRLIQDKKMVDVKEE